jgi:NTP pyrophosphatase (non-canonical NTP hydrolase)
MPDDATTVAELKAAMGRFVAEREWEKFHSPKNLSMGLAIEAAELMEHFLWIDNEESRRLRGNPAKMTEIGDEMADIGCYLLALSNSLGIDLSEAILGKLIKNAQKYPVEKYRGKYESSETSAAAQ